MTDHKGPQNIADLISLLDEDGELAMLARLVSCPADEQANQTWQKEGTLTLPDDSTLRHSDSAYRFTPARHDHPTQTRPSAMRSDHRPALHNHQDEELVHIHINGSSRLNRSQWPQLCELRESTDLSVEVHGTVTTRRATSLAETGNPVDLMGISVEHYEGADVLGPERAYELIGDFAQAVAENGLGQVEAVPRDELSPVQWDALIASCAETVDLEWHFQSGVVDRDWLTANAAQVMLFLRPVP